jgi:hypothetical protein
VPQTPPNLGDPVEVRVRDDVITLVYRGGLRLSQREASLDPVLLKKIIVADNKVQPVAGGLFITGKHAYLFVDRDGEVREDRTRLAANTLISERDGLLLRLEGDDTLTYREARRLISRSGS